MASQLHAHAMQRVASAGGSLILSVLTSLLIRSRVGLSDLPDLMSWAGTFWDFRIGLPASCLNRAVMLADLTVMMRFD
jgi:hypothetical protein